MGSVPCWPMGFWRTMPPTVGAMRRWGCHWMLVVDAADSLLVAVQISRSPREKLLCE